MSDRTPVAILGVTGLVGRRLLARLADHPWFEVVEAAASETSVGVSLASLLARGREEAGLDPDSGAGADARPAGTVRSLEGDFAAPLLVSALPSGIACGTERRLADAGHLVVSNASAHRADPRIPLVLADVNPDHLDLVGDAGGIVTNPNCSVATFAPPLARLHRAFGVEAVSVTTFQAVSGAGANGPAVLDLLDNVLPEIVGEEEKVEREPQKLLGEVVGDEVVSAAFPVSATTTRVPVLHGHLVDVGVRLRGDPDPTEVREALTEAAPGAAAGLPTLDGADIRIVDVAMRPQPRLDRDGARGMRITVGRLRRCPVFGCRFVALAHNLERGAAGAAVANAELALQQGRIPGVRPR